MMYEILYVVPFAFGSKGEGKQLVKLVRFPEGAESISIPTGATIVHVEPFSTR